MAYACVETYWDNVRDVRVTPELKTEKKSFLNSLLKLMPHQRTCGLFGLLNKSFIQTRISTGTIDVPYVPQANAVKILVKGNSVQRAKG